MPGHFLPLPFFVCACVREREGGGGERRRRRRRGRAVVTNKEGRENK